MSWRPHSRFSVSPNAPAALAACDRCGLIFNQRDLLWEMQWRGPRLMKTGFLVCEQDFDVPQQQLRPRILPPDPVQIFNSRPPQYFSQEGNQGFTSYAIDPPAYPDGNTPYAVYEKSYVLAQVAALSGIATPTGLLDLSNTTAASQAAQSLVPADSDRDYILIFNPTALAIAVSFGTAAFNANSTIVVYGGQALFWAVLQGTELDTGAMTVVSLESGQPYYAWVVGNLFLDDGAGHEFVDGDGNFFVV